MGSGNETAYQYAHVDHMTRKKKVMEALFADHLVRFALLHAANNDTEAKKDDSESWEVCCPLPFYLQDLCLLVIINELDCYPTELLDSLPYWLRYRILNNVPALDLARLEHTPFANGINTAEIWKSRVKTDTQYVVMSRGLVAADKTETPNNDSPFQLNISRDRKLYSSSADYLYHSRNSLTTSIVKDLSGTKDSELSVGSHRLLEIASDLLTTSYDSDLEKVTRQLVAIPGNLVLSNLLVGSLHQDCHNPHCSQEVWKKQAVAVVVKDFNIHDVRRYAYYSYNRRPKSDIHLIPRRLLPFCEKPDPVELLSILCSDCHLHPSGVNMHIDIISQSFLPHLRTERLALDDGGLSLPTEGAKYTSMVNSFLENVVSLRLQCDKYGQIGLLVSMIKAAIPGGRLQHLMCTIPDLYMDVVDLLCTLFTLPTFQMLSLELSDAYPLMFSKLLRAFITAPCQHAHKLLIHIKGVSQFPTSLKESQVASMNMQGLTIPSCSLQHKVLKFSSSDDLTKALYLLLQYPTIRLKNITLFTNNAYFHLCAIHPDLQVSKLVISVVGGSPHVRPRVQSQQSQQRTTFQQDLVSLFKITSLDKVCIQGDWGPMTEVKLGLAFGLQARSSLPPLKKLSLELGSQRSYKVREFAMLCDAVFSLPQLKNLELILGKGFADMLRNRRFEDEMHSSWNKKGGGVKLKSISLQAYTDKEFKKVKLITHTLSFSSPKVRSYHHGRFDFFDDDDYHMYSGAYYGYDPWQDLDYYDSDDVDYYD